MEFSAIGLIQMSTETRKVAWRRKVWTVETAGSDGNDGQLKNVCPLLISTLWECWV